MSKLLSRVLAVILAVSVTAMGLVVSHSKNSRAQRPAAARGIDRNQTLIATTAEVLKETSQLRELPVLRPVRSGAQSRQEIERMLVSKLNQQISQQEIHALEQSLKKFGYVNGDFAYRPFIISLLTEQVAGYYDPAARRFHLADWIDLAAQKPVMAHELTHALQDQHFNLRRFENWPRGDSDAELAAHSLIEGDATLTMSHYLLSRPSLVAEFMRSFGSGMSSEKFDKAPRPIRETLLFPYLQGIEWAAKLHQRGGWSALSKAYSQLPQSTEQILHAEKHFNREAPRTVRLPEFTNLLNRRQTANSRQLGRTTNPRSAIRHRKSSSWRQIETDVNGEWGYYLALDEFLKSPSESKRAAAGWGGDRYALYEHTTTGDLFLVQVALWDTVEDAKEFFDAYVKRTALRYSEVTQTPDDKNTNTETTRRWQTREGVVLIELRGARVV